METSLTLNRSIQYFTYRLNMFYKLAVKFSNVKTNIENVPFDNDPKDNQNRAFFLCKILK